MSDITILSGPPFQQGQHQPAELGLTLLADSISFPSTATIERKLSQEGSGVERAFRNSMFLVGLPLAICGFSPGVTGLIARGTLADVAPGLLIPGLVFMIIGWMQSRH